MELTTPQSPNLTKRRKIEEEVKRIDREGGMEGKEERRDGREGWKGRREKEGEERRERGRVRAKVIREIQNSFNFILYSQEVPPAAPIVTATKPLPMPKFDKPFQPTLTHAHSTTMQPFSFDNKYTSKDELVEELRKKEDEDLAKVRERREGRGE